MTSLPLQDATSIRKGKLSRRMSPNVSSLIALLPPFEYNEVMDITALHPRIIKMYTEDFKSIGVIAKELKIYNSLVDKVLKLHAIPIRSRNEAYRLRWRRNSIYHMNESFLDSWSSDLAWFLGLMYADGHIWKDLSRAALTAKSVPFLRQVRDLLQSNFRIELKATTPQLIINRQDRVFKLMSYGLTPAKSYTCKFPYIPKEFLSHFVRGYMDGDGYISIRKEGWLSIGTDIGSKDFRDGLVDVLSEILESPVYITTRQRIRKGWNLHPIYSFRIHGERAAKICRWVYQDSAPQNRWDYKYQKALPFIIGPNSRDSLRPVGMFFPAG